MENYEKLYFPRESSSLFDVNRLNDNEQVKEYAICMNKVPLIV